MVKLMDKSFYWYPHFAVLCHWDGNQIVCRCNLMIFRFAIGIGALSIIHKVQLEQLCLESSLIPQR